MAIIYSYEINDNIQDSDRLIGTATKMVNGKIKNLTKNFSVVDLANFIRAGVETGVVLSVTGTAVDNTDPLNPVINSIEGAVDSVNAQTGVVVLDTSDIAPSINKNYITDAQQIVLGNTSGINTGDQDLSGKADLNSPTFIGNVSLPQTTTINNFSPTINIVKDVVPSAIVTGTVTETILGSYFIPENTFSANDIIKMNEFGTSKIGTNGSSVFRVYINTSNTLVGATQIATVTSGAANLWSKCQRTFALNGGTLSGYGATNSSPSDIINAGSARSVSSFNTTVDNWMFTTVTLGNAADSIQQISFNITN